MMNEAKSKAKRIMTARLEFTRQKHIQYFVHCLKRLPAQYCHLDTNRLTLLHFAVHSLDILGFFDNDSNLEYYGVNKQYIIDWIYSLQTYHSKNRALRIEKSRNRNDVENNESSDSQYHGHGCGGFKGGTFLGFTQNINMTESESFHQYEGFKHYDQGHIAMTYTALCTLIALGDNLEKVDKPSIIQALKTLQLQDGSFQSTYPGSENDMRFLYCACAISFILNDWSGVDADKAVEYIRACRSFDGAFALIPGQEGHGGSTFCAVASLVLMDRIDSELNNGDVCGSSWRDELIQWCVSRQVEGMQGRPNKSEDTCYSYWIGGTLHLLGCDHLLDKEALDQFILSCQTDMGGFSKLKNGSIYPDLLHSFYSLAWLSLSNSNMDDDTSISVIKGQDADTPSKHTLPLKSLDCSLGFRKRQMETLFFISTG
mmetsp:Transcript_10837/g.13713  ORF Transcript_10837/g.13713 Transcript_10837/m.13713 type:complete len:428 (+) Transcript_10837:17-1300(+)